MDGHAGTAPVDAFSSEGLAQASGNVSEWVSDFYDPHFYAKGQDQNPSGPKRGTHRLVRGGNFGSAEPDALKLTRRDARDPSRSSMYFGVRCARDAQVPEAAPLPEGDEGAPSKR